MRARATETGATLDTKHRRVTILGALYEHSQETKSGEMLKLPVDSLNISSNIGMVIKAMSQNSVEVLRQAFSTLDVDEIARSTRELLTKGAGAVEVVDALTVALKEVGDKFDKGELFLLHLVAAGIAAKTVLSEVLEPELLKVGGRRAVLGKVAIGTVLGDIHDIGKSIVAVMLFAAGFEVHDLGVEVPVEKFVEEVTKSGVDVIGLSALLSTTLPVQREVIQALEAAGVRDRVKVVIGGAPATREWAEEIGADSYAEDATEAVKVIRKLMGLV